MSLLETLQEAHSGFPVTERQESPARGREMRNHDCKILCRVLAIYLYALILVGSEQGHDDFLFTGGKRRASNRRVRRRQCPVFLKAGTLHGSMYRRPRDSVVQRGRSKFHPAPRCRCGPFKLVAVLPQEGFRSHFVLRVSAVMVRYGGRRLESGEVAKMHLKI